MGHRSGKEAGSALVLESASMEDLIETLTIMAEQNVILAKGIQKKVEDLRNERQRGRAAEGRQREGDSARRSD